MKKDNKQISPKDYDRWSGRTPIVLVKKPTKKVKRGK